MEPENHLFEKGNHLPNLHFGFHVDFQGCIYIQYLDLPNICEKTLPFGGVFVLFGNEKHTNFYTHTWKIQVCSICTI